jgi:hypothetical protein
VSTYGELLLFRKNLVVAKRLPESHAVLITTDLQTYKAVGKDLWGRLCNGLLLEEDPLGVKGRSPYRSSLYFLDDPESLESVWILSALYDLMLSVRYASYGTGLPKSMCPPELHTMPRSFYTLYKYLKGAEHRVHTHIHGSKGVHLLPRRGGYASSFRDWVSSAKSLLGASWFSETADGHMMSCALDIWDGMLGGIRCCTPAHPGSTLSEVIAEVVAGNLPVEKYLSGHKKFDGSDWGWEFWAHLIISKEQEISGGDWVRVRVSLSSQFEKEHPGEPEDWPTLYTRALELCDGYLKT